MLNYTVTVLSCTLGVMCTMAALEVEAKLL